MGSYHKKHKVMASAFIGVITALITTVLFGCESQVSSDSYGEVENYVISEEYADYVVATYSGRAGLNVTSPGGMGKAAARIGTMIDEQNMSLYVYDRCISACVEFLLPASDQVFIDPETILAVHGNPYLYRYLMNSIGAESSNCYEDSYSYVVSMYTKRKLNVDFWREQHKRISPQSVEKRNNNNDCDIKYITRAKFWLPTSTQLSELWGLKYSGGVCADSAECISKRVLSGWLDPGTPIIVEDTLYYTR
jgi:hypothetical protein